MQQFCTVDSSRFRMHSSVPGKCAWSLQEISGITKCLSMNDVTSDIIVVRSTSSLIWKVFQVFSNNTRLYAIDQKQNIYLHKIITIVHLFTLNTLACVIYFHVNILACLFRKRPSYTYRRTRHKQNLNANHDRHIIDIHYLKSVLYADRIKEPNIFFILTVVAIGQCLQSFDFLHRILILYIKASGLEFGTACYRI